MKYIIIAIVAIVVIVLVVGVYSALVVSSRADNQPNKVVIETDVNRCVCCGVTIPEGRQVCPNCSRE